MYNIALELKRWYFGSNDTIQNNIENFQVIILLFLQQDHGDMRTYPYKITGNQNSAMHKPKPNDNLYCNLIPNRKVTCMKER